MNDKITINITIQQLRELIGVDQDEHEILREDLRRWEEQGMHWDERIRDLEKYHEDRTAETQKSAFECAIAQKREYDASLATKDDLIKMANRRIQELERVIELGELMDKENN